MLGGSRLLVKHVETFPKILFSRPGVRHCSVPNTSTANIVIPCRIERGPTDVLKALASTVGEDFTAFHYKFPDDPFFYLHSSENQEVCALSLEAGKKSARWIFKENPGFFKNQLSDPPIEEFLVKAVIGESLNSEETLLKAIEERNVKEAIKIYEALENENKDVEKSTKQLLLELTCFYNSQERKNYDVEEKWYRLETKEGKEINIWKTEGFAKKLFEKMDASCSLANSAIIQGMLKYDEPDLAHKLFEAAKAKKVKLSVGVYNMFLSKISNSKPIFQYIQEMLREMSEEKIRPNLGTLNAVLKSLSEAKVYKGKTEFLFEILAEFQRLGIQPSLGSYGYIFRLLSHQMLEAKRCQSLSCQIMSKIENENFDILDPSDFKFFSNAGYAFSYRYSDPDLSQRLFDMYLRNNNSKFIVASVDESRFFKDIFAVVLKKKPVEMAMDFYRRYFYRTFTSGSRGFAALMSAIGESHTPEYLPKLWEDIKVTHFVKSRFYLIEFLNLVKIFSDETSQKIFHSVAISFLNLIKPQNYFSEKPEVFSNIIIALVNNGDEQNLMKLLGHLKNQSVIPLNEDATTALYNFGLSQLRIPILLRSLRIAADIDLPTLREMASKALPLLEGESKAWVAELINKQKAEESESRNRKKL